MAKFQQVLRYQVGQKNRLKRKIEPRFLSDYWLKRAFFNSYGYMSISKCLLL